MLFAPTWDVLRSSTGNEMSGEELLDLYVQTREQTEKLSAPLGPEDMSISSMPDVSPTKWHLAHTTWFWETFVLAPLHDGYVPVNPQYSFLFNSYYVQAGERHCRAQRGLLSRPTVEDVMHYRWFVDNEMEWLLLQGEVGEELSKLIFLGVAHEQQHQELMLTDIQHVLWQNPFNAVYSDQHEQGLRRGEEQVFLSVYSGDAPHLIGVAPDSRRFYFDNEGPRHRVIVEDFQIAKWLTTNREYLEFIEDGGYRNSKLWLAAGFNPQRQMPMYWKRSPDGGVEEYTLAGWRPIELDVAVSSVSYFEADAFARWAGARLPTEFEWEVASWQPQLEQLFGSRWQWTCSAYLPYPGYKPAAGAIGEYNGKWMADQWVLRGGSFATPAGHTRRTYRNFWPSDTRWQYTGIRLAK